MSEQSFISENIWEENEPDAKDLIIIASVLKRMVLFDNDHFTNAAALVCAGMNSIQAQDETNLSDLEYELESRIRLNGVPNFSTGYESLEQRYSIFVKYAKRWFSSNQMKQGLQSVTIQEIKSTERSSAMKLVGFDQKDCSGKYFIRCQNHDKKNFRIHGRRGRDAKPI